MLTFLYLASKQGFQVDSYSDEAVGVMAPNEAGMPWVSSIRLNVRIAYSGSRLPTPSDEDSLHHSSHEQCYIANSIKTQVAVRSIHHEPGNA